MDDLTIYEEEKTEAYDTVSNKVYLRFSEKSLSRFWPLEFRPTPTRAMRW